MQDVKFIVTQELGKLAKWLRILGYDTEYHGEREVSDLVIRALKGDRVLLTRSPAFMKYTGIRVVRIESDHVEEQVDQVTRELALEFSEEDIFRRCVECNVLLEDIEKEEVRDKVPEYVFQTQEVFKRCPQCQKIFWQGTHWDMVGKWLEERGFCSS